MKIKGFGYSMVGSREMNQDAYLVSEEKHVYAVADGVGGGMDGDVASSMAIESLKIHEASELRKAFVSAQEKIFTHAEEKHGAPIMGTTLTAAHITEAGKLHLCHIGDSRCYLYQEDCLKLLTKDQEFYDESVNGPVLASYLGMPTDVGNFEIVQHDCDVAPGSRLLLCTDGLYKQMTEPRMVELVKTQQNDPTELVKTLCEEASLSMYSDNITVVYVEIEE